MALTLKLSPPIEIEVDSLGKILLDHWNLSTANTAEKITVLKDGDIRSFMEEFVFLIGRKYDASIKNKREAYKSGEQLENVCDLTDEELEKIAKTYIDHEITNILPYISENDEDKESLIEINKVLRKKLEGETSKEHLRRLVNASIEAMRVQNKRMLDQFSNIAKKWREPLLKNSVAISKLDSQINDIISIKIPPIPTVQNPIHETNSHLSNVSAQLEKLTLLTEAEIEQARLLNEKSSSLLEASTESSEQAKKSIYVATIAILISAGLSLWSIIETISGNKSSGVSLDKLIGETKLNSNIMSSNAYELKQLMEKQQNQYGQNVSLKELEAQQLDYLSKIVKILAKMESRPDSEKQVIRKKNSSIGNSQQPER